MASEAPWREHAQPLEFLHPEDRRRVGSGLRLTWKRRGGARGEVEERHLDVRALLDGEGPLELELELQAWRQPADSPHEERCEGCAAIDLEVGTGGLAFRECPMAAPPLSDGLRREARAMVRRVAALLRERPDFAHVLGLPATVAVTTWAAVERARARADS